MLGSNKLTVAVTDVAVIVEMVITGACATYVLYIEAHAWVLPSPANMGLLWCSLCCQYHMQMTIPDPGCPHTLCFICVSCTGSGQKCTSLRPKSRLPDACSVSAGRLHEPG